MHWMFYLLVGIIGLGMIVGPPFLFDAFERWEHEEYTEKNDHPIGW